MCGTKGPSRKWTGARAHTAADGAIVGSAIVRQITENKGESRETLVARVGELVSELIKPLGK